MGGAGCTSNASGPRYLQLLRQAGAWLAPSWQPRLPVTTRVRGGGAERDAAAAEDLAEGRPRRRPAAFHSSTNRRSLVDTRKLLLVVAIV